MIIDEIDKRELRKYTVFESPREFFDMCYSHGCGLMYPDDSVRFRLIAFYCDKCDVSYAVKIGVDFKWDELTKSESKNIKFSETRRKMMWGKRKK